jgi:hypothetical protein
LDCVIDRELAAFLDRPVMLVTALRGSDGKAAIARGMGVRLSADRGQVDVLVSRAQWPKAVQGLKTEAPIALTACDPTDYTTFQIKGRLLSFTDAEGPDLTLGAAYCARIFNHLKSLGVEDRQIGCWITAEDLVRLRFIPMAVFHQTPGATAGAIRASAPESTLP